MKSELDKINERIVYWSNTKPRNMNREEHRIFLDKLFDEKRRLLAGQPTPNISKLND